MLIQKKTTQPFLETVIASLDEQPLALGTVAVAVIKLTADSNTDNKELAHAVSADAGLSGAIIMKANSAFYGGASRVTSLPWAVAKLGCLATRSLAITHSIRAMFRGGDQEGLERYLWRHSLSVGIGARIIMRHAGSALVEEAFLGGLLHDIAKLVLLQRLPAIYKPVLSEMEKTNSAQQDIESARMGFTHAELGAMILDRWNFAPMQIKAVEFHHKPDEAVSGEGDNGAQEDARLLAHAVCLGNDLVKAMECQPETDSEIDPASTPSSRYFGFPQEEIAQVTEQLEDRLANELQVFGQP